MGVDRQAMNQEWSVAGSDGNVPTWERVAVAVLMDIRRELQTLNAVFRCHNFQDIPFKLDRIEKNTKKPRPKPKKKVAAKGGKR